MGHRQVMGEDKVVSMQPFPPLIFFLSPLLHPVPWDILTPFLKNETGSNSILENYKYFFHHSMSRSLCLCICGVTSIWPLICQKGDILAGSLKMTVCCDLKKHRCPHRGGHPIGSIANVLNSFSKNAREIKPMILNSLNHFSTSFKNKVSQITVMGTIKI